MGSKFGFCGAFSLVGMIVIILSGCSPPSSPIPTLSSTPPKPSNTPTLRPSVTPTSTPTVTPRPINLDNGLVERIPLTSAGFSFIPPILHVDLAPYSAMLVDTDQTFFFSLVAVPDVTDFELETALDQFLSNMHMDIPDLEATSRVDIEVSGASGVASDFSGTQSDDTFRGRISIIQPDTGPPVFALAISFDPPIGRGWDAEGSRLYYATLETLEFFYPEPQLVSCKVASDPTYGYNKENPVKVGGDAYGGPARARAFLDALSGPNGEIVTYERTGSLEYGETILDAYSLTYPGIGSSATIYLDEYSFDVLMAPVGFTCSGPFPISPQRED